MRNAYLEQLYLLAKEDKNVMALISDNGAIVYDRYRKDFPNQYINFGISEANMIAAAAGMASRGKIPFAYTIGAFLAYRAIEFIRNDVCYQNQNVKIVGIGSGCVYSSLGPTHHATEDISILRAMPGVTLFSPASPLEARKVTQKAYEINGPVYIRLGRNGETEIYSHDYNFEFGKGVVIREGNDVTLIGTGSMVAELIEVAAALEKKGVSVCVVNMHTLKPFDEELIVDLAERSNVIITVEDHTIYGGLGSIVSEIIAENRLNVKFKRMGLCDYANGYGSYDELKENNRIGREHVVKCIMSIMEVL